MVRKIQKFVVPWSDESEWNAVRDQILSLNINQLSKAYQTIFVWKLRYSALPAYVESTFNLLQVMLIKSKSNDAPSNWQEYDLQLAYSTALIRFVNHVSNIIECKGKSLYSLAKIQNIPDWMINLRHEAAHSQDLPPLDALDRGLNISIQWLCKHYWQKKSNIHGKNLKCHGKFCTKENAPARQLFQKFFFIWNMCSKKFFQNGNINKKFIFHLKKLLDHKNIYFSQVAFKETGKLKQFLNMYSKAKNETLNTNQTSTFKGLKSNLLKLIRTVSKERNYKDLFLIALLESSFLSASNSVPKKWQKILQLVQDLKLFQKLIDDLFKMSGNEHSNASKWLIILYPSIGHLYKQWAEFKAIKRETKVANVQKIKKEIISLHCSKNQKQIHLKLKKPPVITFENMIGILMNPYLPNSDKLICYLNLIKPPPPDSTIQLIKDLVNIVKLQEFNKNPLDDSEKIFTVQDLETAMTSRGCASSHEDEVNGITKSDNQNIWMKSKIDIRTWSRCPLGLLPSQTKVDCSLSSDLKWTSNAQEKAAPLPANHLIAA